MKKRIPVLFSDLPTEISLYIHMFVVYQEKIDKRKKRQIDNLMKRFGWKQFKKDNELYCRYYYDPNTKSCIYPNTSYFNDKDTHLYEELKAKVYTNVYNFLFEHGSKSVVIALNRRNELKRDFGIISSQWVIFEWEHRIEYATLGAIVSNWEEINKLCF